ncbi:MAG: hypothetical protein MJZ00_03090 [Paludibacteraceae bacterium]|nr:hypothetical protein [Paludibacteraceae bacterium]
MKQVEIEIDGIKYKTFVRENSLLRGLRASSYNSKHATHATEVFPPIAGKVIDIISVGTKIKKGDVVATIEAMKMYNRIFSPVDGIVKEVNYSVGDNAIRSTALVVVE